MCALMVHLLHYTLNYSLVCVCIMCIFYNTDFLDGFHHLTAYTWVQFQAYLCGICGGQNGTGSSFSVSTLLFSCVCDATNAPC